MRRVLGALAVTGAPGTDGPGPGPRGPCRTVPHGGLARFTPTAWADQPFDTGVRLALYRVVQESLTNVLRHAPGTASVELEFSRRDRWEVTVSDRGGVFPAPQSEGAGLGLVGMRERVELLGGTMDAGPWQHGWRVYVSIPVRRRSDDRSHTRPARG